MTELARTIEALLFIAPDGTVQGIFIGHSLTLREELTACVRGLLKK